MANCLQLSLIPQTARVVVCGAGVVGTSVAYHLAKRGWKEIIVLEQGRIGCGTSWHGPGIVSQFRSPAERALISHSAEFYQTLQQTGHDVGWYQCGSLGIAQTKDRWTALRRLQTQAKVQQLDCHLLTPREVREFHPHLRVDDIQGGVWVPSDGVANSLNLCNVLVKLAQLEGVNYIEECKLQKVFTENNSVTSVETSLGKIQCEYFVNCSGLWSHEVALNTDTPVKVPVHAALHTYITTRPFTEIAVSPQLPIVQDYDGRVYAREWKNGLLAGGFEVMGKPVFHNFSPERLEFQNNPEHWNRFKPLYDMLTKRFPALSQVEVEYVYTAPENFTPDGKWIFGETPEVKNYFVACGMNGNSVLGAGGIGKAMAEWIVDGQTNFQALPFDIRRFVGLHNNKKFLRERVKEVAGHHYSLAYPLQNEFRLARKLRCSPLYTVQEAAGGVFGEKMGFERALYFDTTKTGGSLTSGGTFGKPDWFDFVKAEYLTCRTGVGLIDLSSLTKLELFSTGKEVVDYLQLLCSNDINIPVHSIVQTGMLNDRGGFENDCIVVRRAENHFFVVSPTVQHTRIQDWLSRHLPGNKSVTFSDVTSMYTVLNVVGPKSKELMTELTNCDMNILPFSYKEVNVGYASGIMVMGFTNTGEPGYSIYVPSEYALHIYNRFMTVGRDYDIRNVGYFALRYLRIEKFVPFWGEEMNGTTTPFEVNRGYKVKLEKDYFFGKFALLKQQQKGLFRRLVHFTIEDHDLNTDIWAWGKEPILRNGVVAGMTTSTGYGFTVDRIVCMGFIQPNLKGEAGNPVTNEYITAKDVQFEIDIAGKKHPLKASLHPPKIPVISLDSLHQYSPKARKSLIAPKK